MLVLSRKVGERIHIGNDIFLEVRRVAGSRVTVAINAPKSVRILRGELMDSAGCFDVLEDSSAKTSESSIDTVIMSGEQISAALTSELTDQPLAAGQDIPVG